MKEFLTRPENRVPIFLMIALAIVAVYLYGESHSAKRNADETVRQFNESREYAKKIIELREQPELITAEFRSSLQIAQFIKTAMTVAELPEENLIRIEPRGTQRIAKTPYLEQPFHLELQRVTMPQLVRFLHHLSVHDRLETSDLRLHILRESFSPRRGTGEEREGGDGEDEGPEFWNAELVLTNVLFSP